MDEKYYVSYRDYLFGSKRATRKVIEERRGKRIQVAKVPLYRRRLRYFKDLVKIKSREDKLVSEFFEKHSDEVVDENLCFRDKSVWYTSLDIFHSLQSLGTFERGIHGKEFVERVKRGREGKGSEGQVEKEPPIFGYGRGEEEPEELKKKLEEVSRELEEVSRELERKKRSAVKKEEVEELKKKKKELMAKKKWLEKKIRAFKFEPLFPRVACLALDCTSDEVFIPWCIPLRRPKDDKRPTRSEYLKEAWKLAFSDIARGLKEKDRKKVESLLEEGDVAGAVSFLVKHDVNIGKLSQKANEKYKELCKSFASDIANGVRVVVGHEGKGRWLGLLQDYLDLGLCLNYDKLEKVFVGTCKDGVCTPLVYPLHEYFKHLGKRVFFSLYRPSVYEFGNEENALDDISLRVREGLVKWCFDSDSMWLVGSRGISFAEYVAKLFMPTEEQKKYGGVVVPKFEESEECKETALKYGLSPEMEEDAMVEQVKKTSLVYAAFSFCAYYTCGENCKDLFYRNSVVSKGYIDRLKFCLDSVISFKSRVDLGLLPEKLSDLDGFLDGYSGIIKFVRTYDLGKYAMQPYESYKDKLKEVFKEVYKKLEGEGIPKDYESVKKLKPNLKETFREVMKDAFAKFSKEVVDDALKSLKSCEVV